MAILVRHQETRKDRMGIMKSLQIQFQSVDSQGKQITTSTTVLVSDSLDMNKMLAFMNHVADITEILSDVKL